MIDQEKINQQIITPSNITTLAILNIDDTFALQLSHRFVDSRITA